MNGWRRILLFLIGIHCIACSAYIISPGIRSDNEVVNVEKPPIIRNDRIRNDNLFVSLFFLKGEDLEETFFDPNNFSPENESFRSKLTLLWEKAKETKNVILIQAEDAKGKNSIKQIKRIQAKFSNCEPLQTVSYQYNFIRFMRRRSAARREVTYPKIPESEYKEEVEPALAYVSKKEIPALRSIFIFEKKCIIDSKALFEVKIETDETLIFKFQNAK